MALYVGDSDNIVLMLGANEVSAAYIGDLQVYPLSPFAVSPSTLHMSNMDLTAQLRIKSPEAWTITETSGGWMTLSANSGAAGVTMVTVTATENAATRNATITVTTANYTKTVSVEQMYIVYDGMYVENVSNTTGTLTILEGVNLTKNLDYSSDGLNWTTAATGQPCTITVPAGGKMYLRGTNSEWRAQGDGHNTFSMDVDWKIGGNLLSIIDKDNYATLQTVPQYCFQNAFSLNNYLIDATDANFGTATTLGQYSLHNAFRLCPLLEGVPDTSTITRGDYWCMIGGCLNDTSLVRPYDLHNMTSSDTSSTTYQALYEGCSSLTVAYSPNVVNVWRSSINLITGNTQNGTIYLAAGSSRPSYIPSSWTTAEYNYSVTLSGANEPFDYATSDGRSGTVSGSTTTLRLDYPQTLSITTAGPKYHLEVNGTDKGNGPSYTLDYLDLVNGDVLTCVHNSEPS